MTVQGDKMKRMAERVRALLALADHPNTPGPEAETARTQAEALMFKYRVEAASLDDQAEKATTPEWRDVRVAAYRSEFEVYYAHLIDSIVRHLDCMKYEQYEDGYRVARVVGYEADLEVFDVLQTAAVSAFGSRLEPTYRSDETDAQNALRMRQGGMERNRIGVVLFGSSATVNEMKAKNRKVTKLIKEEGKRQGIDAEALLGRGNNIKTYRESFANAFVWEFRSRLQRMASQRSTEGVLVLGDRKKRIAESLYERYPHLRPSESRQITGGESARSSCAKCKGAKSGYCRDHSYLKPSTAKARGGSWSAVGHRAGQAAARSVDIGSAGTAAVGR